MKPTLTVAAVLGAAVLVASASPSSGGLRPPERPYAIVRGAPVPRSTPAAHSLRSFAAALETGRVEGRVSITVPVATAPPSAAYGARRVGRAAARTGSELSNVVVFIQNAPRPAQLPVTRARILQENETFIPRVVAITRGSAVDFPNGDPFFHDVFSLSRSGTFDLGSFPKGQTKSYVFRRAGLVKVYCHIHSHMSASIMIFDHPFFAIPRPDGMFALDAIPEGSYQISAWHERIGEHRQSIRIERGRTSEIQFALPMRTK